MKEIKPCEVVNGIKIEYVEATAEEVQGILEESINYVPDEEENEITENQIAEKLEKEQKGKQKKRR